MPEPGRRISLHLLQVGTDTHLWQSEADVAQQAQTPLCKILRRVVQCKGVQHQRDTARRRNELLHTVAVCQLAEGTAARPGQLLVSGIAPANKRKVGGGGCSDVRTGQVGRWQVT